MGSWWSRSAASKAVKYNDIKPKLKPFDLILFSGSDMISDLIKFAEKRELTLPPTVVSPTTTSTETIWSHIGMVVTSDILDHPNVLPGKLYILESTASGTHGYGVPNIEGNSFIGVQLRDLDLVISAYLIPESNKIAITPIINSPLMSAPKNDIKTKFTTLFNEINGTPYDFNLIDLGCTVFSWCRRYHTLADRIVKSGSWLFCSELITMVYKDFDILPSSIDPIDISPMGYVGWVNPDIPSTIGAIPMVTSLPVIEVTSTT